MGVRWVFPSGTVVELGEMGIKVQVFMVGEVSGCGLMMFQGEENRMHILDHVLVRFTLRGRHRREQAVTEA